MASQFVIPGDTLGSCTEYDSGAGTCERNGLILATLVGTKTVLPVSISGKPATLAVVPATGSASAPTIDIGSTVLCKVVRITQLVCYVEMLVCDGRVLPQPVSAVIRKENIRETEVDKVRMEDCFQPLDLVQAMVASLGDARSYYLSTALPELGVISAKSRDGVKLRPLDYTSMQEDMEDGLIEKRKVAKPVT